MTIEGFHEGELAMKRAAGVEEVAARRVGMLATPHLGGGLGQFLAQRDFAVVAARDENGLLWASPLWLMDSADTPCRRAASATVTSCESTASTSCSRVSNRHRVVAIPAQDRTPATAWPENRARKSDAHQID